MGFACLLNSPQVCRASVLMNPNGYAGESRRAVKVADFMTPEQRSHAMSRVRGKETRIECAVRSSLHAKGFRFRKNPQNIPGRPDIVLPKYKAVVFIHGCFWHGHAACKKSALPSTRHEFWESKIARTRERDREKSDQLISKGWRIAVIWQCSLETKQSLSSTVDTLASWLRSISDCLELPS